MTAKAQKKRRPLTAALSLVICLLVLGGGVLGMLGLLALKQPPEQAEIKERVLEVEVATVQPEDVPVVISGFGQVRAVDQVALAPEVAGRVIELHPRLKVGEVIAAGEVLFRIDPADYEANLARAEGSAAQLRSTLEGLRKQQALDREMLTTLDRTFQLSDAEYNRLKGLYESDDVGTLSGVERAEMARNQAKTTRDQLSNALDLYPSRIQEVEGGLKAAEAQVAIAKNNLERTIVKAPFVARVTMETLEVGQVVAPGAPVVHLANDSALEISVPLDSRDARNWLQFSGRDSGLETAWFSGAEPVQCTIRWTEDPRAHVWEGTLARVEEFDPDTRTLTVAVRVDKEQALSRDDARLPLVAGMFCSVEIPGKQMQQVYRVPRWAVSFEGDIFIAKGDRLQSRRVEVLRQQGEDAFIAAGLNPGEQVITTRLVNPAPNSLLHIVEHLEEPEVPGMPSEEQAS
jgi:multidrug efflux system membrane fusion protein